MRAMAAAGSKFLAILCSSAVVELVLKSPRARRLRPCERHASTAAHRDVMVLLSSWTNFLVTASSMICFTSFLTVLSNLSLASSSAAFVASAVSLLLRNTVMIRESLRETALEAKAIASTEK
uniref:Uncharacterized protein n=1 Tax=Ixodes ricinus TaxID=34613 RepID=A0A6B0UP34_IXORI